MQYLKYFHVQLCMILCFHSNNQFHRLDGPAVEYEGGYKAWWINGKRHRIDGPAIIYSNGTKDWWLDNEFIDVNSQEEFEEYLKLRHNKFKEWWRIKSMEKCLRCNKRCSGFESMPNRRRLKSSG